MQVNYKMVAYALGISDAKAKQLIFLYIKDPVRSNGYIESSMLRQLYRHPSPTLDGKDKIEYICQSIRKGIGPILLKELVEDIGNLKNGKLIGKYKALYDIMNDEDINKVHSILKRRRDEFIKSGGVFKSKSRKRL